MMEKIMVRGHSASIAILLSLFLGGCLSRPFPQKLSELNLMEIELAMGEVHQAQQRNQELVSLQTKLQNRLQAVGGVSNVSVAIWRDPEQERSLMAANFLVTAESVFDKEASASRIMSSFVSITKEVLPKPDRVTPSFAETFVGKHRVVVLNGVFHP